MTGAPPPRAPSAAPGIALVVLVWIAIVGAIAGLLLHSQTQNRNQIAERLGVRIAASAEFMAADAADVLARERASARNWLAGPVVDRQTFARVLGDVGFDSGLLLDKGGRVLQSAPSGSGLVGGEIARRYPSLAAASAGRSQVSGVVSPDADAVPVVGFAVPFETVFGRRVYSGNYDVSRAPLGVYLRQLITVRGGRAFLVDASRRVIATSEPTAAAGRDLASADPRLARATGAARSSGQYASPSGNQYFTVAPIAGTPWRLVASEPDTSLFKSVSGPNLWLPWLAVAGFALAGLLVAVLSARLLAGRARLQGVNRELNRVSRLDSLTRLHNRRHVEEALEAAVSACRRHALGLAVILADIDHFKRINDDDGHLAGDAVLCETAAALRDSVRTEDTLGRWGGEEFLALLPGTDLDGALTLAERLRWRIETTTRVTVTVGVAVWSDESADDLIRRVDDALYAGKAAGRNNVQAAPMPRRPRAAGGV